MIEYLEIFDMAKELQHQGAHHVYIAVMDEDGQYRSLRSSANCATDVKPFIKELQTDPSHEVACNLAEITSSGSRPKGDIWES